MNPEKKRAQQKRLNELDAKISYAMGRLRGAESGGVGSEDRAARTSELLRLSLEKQQLLQEGWRFNAWSLVFVCFPRISSIFFVSCHCLQNTDKLFCQEMEVTRRGQLE